MADDGNISILLRRAASGDEEAKSDLYSRVFNELHRIASQLMRSERPDHTLQATALVNEAFLRLGGVGADWQDRLHFFATSARVMRRILVDHARGRAAGKRGTARRPLSLDEIAICSPEQDDLLDALDEALRRLHEMDERQASIVEWRFFGGLTEEEIAQLLGVSIRTVRREWQSARAWLYGELKSG